MTDKNQAILNFLIDCPAIQDNPVYFNFLTAKDGSSQIVTSTNDTAIDRKYVDGSVLRQFTFSLVTFMSISDNEIIFPDEATNPITSDSVTLSNENVEDMATMQGIIDWVNEQNDNANYPDFGSNAIIDEMEVTTTTPRFDGVNTEVTPMLAIYSIAIRISYIDTTKVIWS